MRSEAVIRAVACLVLICCVAGLASARGPNAGTPQRATLVVPDDYPTIQAALDAAATGDTVYVRAGTYFEHPVIDKPLTLAGEDAATTIVDGGGSGDVLHVAASGATIEHLTLQHSGADPSFGCAGLRATSVEDIRITNCRLAGNELGVLSCGMSYSFIVDCVFEENQSGLVTDIDYSGETWLAYANDYNHIQNCRFQSNDGAAIRFTHDPSNFGNRLQGNLIADNGGGMYLTYSYQNEIAYNAFLNNVGRAISFSICLCGAYDNVIHHNLFIGNHGGSEQAYESWSEGINYWYSPESNVGNFWSDYVGEDLMHDGRGDTPYVIPEGGHNDECPLMYPYVTGDMNLDALRNSFDIDPFVLALTDPAVYQGEFWIHPALHGDCNFDGTLDAFDIDAFIDALLRPDELIFPGNRPPAAPSAPWPADGASGVESPFIRWIGSDPDLSDYLVYDVYFGVDPAPALVSVGQAGDDWFAGTLQVNTTYYWQIVARDRFDVPTPGPVWSFTTGADVWLIDTVDSDLAFDTEICMRLDAQGRPHFGYRGAFSELRYAHWTGDAWDVQFVDWALGGLSLALDGEGLPRFSYGTSDSLAYTFWTGSGWQATTILETDLYGSALEVDPDGVPYIACVSREYFSQRTLKCVSWTGTDWLIETLCPGLVNDIGLALDSLGSPHIGHLGGQTLYYAFRDSSAWVVETPYTTEFILEGGSLVLDSADRPHVTFIDAETNSLRYAVRSAGDWTIETVAEPVQWDTSLQLDLQQRPQIGYVTWDPPYGATLRLLSDTGTEWISCPVAADIAGQLIVARDAEGRPHLCYTTLGGELRYARKSSWAARQ